MLVLLNRQVIDGAVHGSFCGHGIVLLELCSASRCCFYLLDFANSTATIRDGLAELVEYFNITAFLEARLHQRVPKDSKPMGVSICAAACGDFSTLKVVAASIVWR